MDKKTLIPVYEVAQLDTLQGNKGTLLAMDVWTRRELTRRNIPHLSLGDYLPEDDYEELMVKVQSLARTWYRLPELAFFRVSDISIGEALESSVDYYLQRLFYYLRAVDTVLAKHAEFEHLIVPYTTTPPILGGGPLVLHEQRALADAALFCARIHNRTIEFVGTAPTTATIETFPKASLPQRLFFTFYNTLVGITPRKKHKFFASEYWSHIKPAMDELPDAELILMDRSEFRSLSLMDMWKHRIRFLHPLQYRNKEVRKETARVLTSFKEGYPEACRALLAWEELSFKGHSLGETLLPVFEFLITQYAERILSDTLALSRLLKEERIEKALVRVSMGGHQHHFYIISKLAPKLGIPSIEIQHANEVNDPRCVHSRLAATYLAAYGASTKRVYIRNHGYEDDRIRLVGSPRFDHYIGVPAMSVEERATYLRTLGLDPSRPVVFVGMPAEHINLYFVSFDSFMIELFLTELKRVQKEIPGAQFICKFRQRNLTWEYRVLLRELFGDDVYAGEFEDSFTLMQISDVLLIGNSTLLVEGMLAHRPIVLYPTRTHDSYFREDYAGIVPIPSSTTDLVADMMALASESDTRRAKALHTQDTYLKTGYAFDGGASARLAALLREPLPVLSEK